jgi:hypothetical protein
VLHVATDPAGPYTPQNPPGIKQNKTEKTKRTEEKGAQKKKERPMESPRNSRGQHMPSMQRREEKRREEKRREEKRSEVK